MTKTQDLTQLARRPILVLLLVQLLYGVVVSAQYYFFPIYVKESLGMAAVVVSTYVSIRQMSGLVASLLGGTLIDTLGRKWTLALGLACCALGNAAFVSRTPWMVGLLWMVTGVALSLASLGAQGYLIGAAGGTALGVSSALYHWGYTLGGALGSPIAGRLLDTRGYAAFGPAVVALSGGTALLAALFLPRLERSAGGRARVPWQEALAGYVEIIRKPAAIRLALLRFLPTCFYGMAMVLIPLLINAQTESKTSVALFATASQILAALAQLAAGRVSDRVGPRPPTLTAMGAVLTAAVGLSLFAGQLWGLVAFGILGIAAAWALSTMMPVLVSAYVREAEQGRVLGVLVLVWNLAMTLSAMIGGALVEARPGLPFAIAAVLNVGSVLLARAFFRTRTTRDRAPSRVPRTG